MVRLYSLVARPSAPVLGAVLLAILGVAFAQPATQTQNVRRSTIPVDSTWPGARPGQLEISDEGDFVVYNANKGEGWKLYIHRLGEPEGVEVPGLGNVPYFGSVSPSGRWLLFGQKAWIWKVPIEGGAVTKVFQVNNFKMWETDDSIIVSRGRNGLSRVTADGTMQREDFASVDRSTGATGYQRPSPLPDGRGALVSVGYGTGSANRHIGVVSFPGGELTIIPERGAINPRYAASGHILYTVGNVLKAIPFDIERLEATGPAATIVEGVHVYSNNASQFDISSNGTLVYVPGPYEVGRTWPKLLVWVDREGREQPLHTSEKNYWATRISPDRRYVAARVGSGLHLYENRSATWSVPAASGTYGAVWAADNDSIFFTQDRAFGRLTIDGGEWQEMLAEEDAHEFSGNELSPDGSRVLGYGTERRGLQYSRYLMSVSTDAPVTGERLLGASDMDRRSPTVSEDGNWIAYVEKDENGVDHVFVEPYPSGGRRLRVSDEAAAEPAWGRGVELFYVNASHMVSARLDTSPQLGVVETTPLFSTKRYGNVLNTARTVYDYDQATDRFLMPMWSIPNLPGTDIQVIENAFELLNRLAPSR